MDIKFLQFILGIIQINTDMNKMKKDWNMLTHTILPIVLQNKKIQISKPTNFMNMVVPIQNKIYIDKYTIIKYFQQGSI